MNVLVAWRSLADAGRVIRPGRVGNHHGPGPRACARPSPRRVAGADHRDRRTVPGRVPHDERREPRTRPLSAPGRAPRPDTPSPRPRTSARSSSLRRP